MSALRGLLLALVLVCVRSLRVGLGGAKRSGAVAPKRLLLKPLGMSAQGKQEGLATPPTRVYPLRHDNVLERAAILVLSLALSRFLTTEELKREARVLLRWDSSFVEFCGITKLLLRKANGSVESMQARIVKLLNMLVPPQAKKFFKDTYLTNARLICEQSSEWIARFGLISWLIGSDVERFTVSVPKAADEAESWLSGLEAKQCRYLLESGCKSACVNICKIPTQAFFNDVVGLPLRMTPDYDKGSCKFEFGLAPLPKEEDPAFTTPCYLGCSVSQDKGASTRCS